VLVGEPGAGSCRWSAGFQPALDAAKTDELP
jgi:hypothetical protein